ncbi:hypothetical protein OUZ56_013841 [Daphnia magna]|uniref:Uncharacterized protein n=1 Tax=Daphnia magna TaxID=35525 RepID=A0ABQ9Z732_9CRUS|nr:hypothetical protein OUZ56_013841 [Daphnia magna]
MELKILTRNYKLTARCPHNITTSRDLQENRSYEKKSGLMAFHTRKIKNLSKAYYLRGNPNSTQW